MGFFSSIGNFFKDNVGSVLGVVGDVAGGLLGLSGTKDSNATEAAIAQQQMAYQKELHQNQIQWRVEDAKKAGIHPLAALGVSSASYSPVSVSPSSPDYSFLSDMGQNLNRAIMQGKTDKERKAALDLQKTKDAIDIRKAKADADYAETQAAAARFQLQQQLFPPAPKVNKREDPNLPSSTFGKTLHRLFNIAIHGNSLMLIKNPDIADSITESAWDSAAANILREVENGNPAVIDDLISGLPKHMRKGIDRGELRLTSVPGSGVFRIVPVGPEEEFDRYKIY